MNSRTNNKRQLDGDINVVVLHSGDHHRQAAASSSNTDSQSHTHSLTSSVTSVSANSESKGSQLSLRQSATAAAASVLTSSRHTPVLNDILHNLDDLVDHQQQMQPIILNFASPSHQSPSDIKPKYANKEATGSWPRHSHSQETPITIPISIKLPSRSLNDYFVVRFESTRQLELNGSDNCLFLALARSILFKINFLDSTYQRFIRIKCLKKLIRKDFKFDSDLKLQELIRKRLCLHWLSFVRDGKFITSNCKYSNSFSSVSEFLFQVYQLSINNFSKNRLFNEFALADLAELFYLNLFVFHITNNQDYDLLVYKSNSSTNLNCLDENQFIYLLNDNNSDQKLRFKWLVPASRKQLVNERFFNSSFNVAESILLMKAANRNKETTTNNQQTTMTASNLALRSLSTFTQFKVLLTHKDLEKCLGMKLMKSSVAFLFYTFLKESPVHTLMVISDFSYLSKLFDAAFDSAFSSSSPPSAIESILLHSKSSNSSSSSSSSSLSSSATEHNQHDINLLVLIKKLNRLWGQPHFTLREICSRFQSFNLNESQQQPNQRVMTRK